MEVAARNQGKHTGKISVDMLSKTDSYAFPYANVPKENLILAWNFCF